MILFNKVIIFNICQGGLLSDQGMTPSRYSHVQPSCCMNGCSCCHANLKTRIPNIRCCIALVQSQKSEKCHRERSLAENHPRQMLPCKRILHFERNIKLTGGAPTVSLKEKRRTSMASAVIVCNQSPEDNT